MENFLIDYSNLLLKWLHVIAAIAWIGESIYFVMLDLSLRPPKSATDKEKGIFGEMWAVHGGGFYHNQKYLTSPAKLPQDLHWSYWKAYTTWLSGFVLFLILYVHNADIYLVNKASPWAWVSNLDGTQASLVAVIFLILGYNIYSRLCRIISPTVNRDGLLSVAVGILMIVISWLSMQIFPGRAAFLITGAVMATCMSANVFFWIIPGQRRMVKALRAGEKPNPLDGAWGKQRSVHNTYFTLPVIFLMLSNHYAFTYTSEYAWIIMALFIFAGAIIRQYFVLRHTGKNQLRYPVISIILLAIIAFLAMPKIDQNIASNSDIKISQVHEIMVQRCVSCHAAKPTQAGMASAPAGILLETEEQIIQYAKQIKPAVASEYMPLANLTNMTPEEREIIASWQPKP